MLIVNNCYKQEYAMFHSWINSFIHCTGKPRITFGASIVLLYIHQLQILFPLYTSIYYPLKKIVHYTKQVPTVQPTPKLNHIMEVSDGTDTATFVAHGRLAESMLCCKVDTLIRIKEEEGDVNASKVLYEILIRQKAFQVHTPTDSRQNHLGFFQVTRFNMRKCLWACYYVHHLFNLDEATAEELEYRDNVHIDESSGYGILNDAHTAPLTSVVFGHLQMLQLNDKLF